MKERSKTNPPKSLLKAILDNSRNEAKIKELAKMIQQGTKHKVFVSYYHKEDEVYRSEFERLYGNLFINKSVGEDDIDADNSDEYIKRLIQEEYITDVSVLVVLVGANTSRRMHVDWEISAALNKKVGGYSGLVGFCLPTNSDYTRNKYDLSITPGRLADNIVSGYAHYYNWTEDASVMKQRIQKAFDARISLSNKINNSRIQMSSNS